MNFKYSLSTCLIGALMVAPVIAQEGGANLATGAAYRLLPGNVAGRDVPKGVLTDGKIASDPIWEDNANALRLNGNSPFSVTFDLKERSPIGGLAISSAAGVATSGKDVQVWPGAVDIYVSDDNRTYYHAGELMSLNDAQGEALPEFGSYARRKVRATGLKAHGRYVKLVISQSRAVYLDEVEIFRGDDALLELPREGEGFKGEEAIIAQHKIEAPNVNAEQKEKEASEQAKRERLEEMAIRRRYYSDIASLSAKAAQLPQGAGQAITQRLAALKERAIHEPVKLEERNTLPAGPIGRAILAEQAELWRAAGKGGESGVVVWPSDHWGFLNWLQEPEWQAKPELKAAVLKGESRSFSLNISNAGAEAATLELRLKDLKGLEANVKVHSVEWTESPWRLAVASALPEAEKSGSGYSITVPSGGTRQIWFVVTGGEQSGEQKGTVELVRGEQAIAQVPVSLTVYPMAFPEKAALHHSGFECASNEGLRRRYGVFREALPEFLKVSRDAGMDAPWTTRTEFSFGRFNAEHRYAPEGGAPSPKAFRQWVSEFFPGAYRYHVALTVKTPDRRAVIDGCDFAKDPEGFQQRVNTWLGYWKKEVEALGRKPEDFYLKIIDEPGYNSAAPFIEDDVIEIWAKAIHASGTGFKVFLNPIYDEPWGASKGMMDEADVICVKYSHFLRFGEQYRDFYLSRRAKQEISIYECYGAPGHLYDPYSYFRLQAWMAWEIGAKTMFFWNYADSGTGAGFVNSWNTGHNHWYYTPLFITPNSIVTSKQMVAIHEGIADFQVLDMLRDAAAKYRTDAQKAGLVKQAEALMKKVKSEVLAGSALEEPRWMWPSAVDRAPADRLREEAQQLLVELEK